MRPLSTKVLGHNMLLRPVTLGGTPPLSDKYTGFIYVRCTTHRTNGFKPLPKDEASWLSVLLKAKVLRLSIKYSAEV